MNAFKFHFGNFECIVLKDSFKQIPLVKQFPQVSEEDLKSALATCGLDNMKPTVSFSCLYLNTGDKKIMIDCGYQGEHLEESMAQVGISYDEIDAVIITHGDGDHIGGIENFKNAKFYIPQQAFESWTSKTGQQQLLQEFEKVFQAILPPHILGQKLLDRRKYGTEILPKLRERIELIDMSKPIFPGIKMIEAFGHRSDHYAVELRSEGESLLHIVDAFRHPIQVIHPEWYSFIDSYPEDTTATIKLLLERARKNNSLIFGTHLQFPGLGFLDDGVLKMKSLY